METAEDVMNKLRLLKAKKQAAVGLADNLKISAHKLVEKTADSSSSKRKAFKRALDIDTDSSENEIESYESLGSSDDLLDYDEEEEEFLGFDDEPVNTSKVDEMDDPPPQIIRFDGAKSTQVEISSRDRKNFMVWPSYLATRNHC